MVALSGGVGGARFLRGLAELVAADELVVIGNVGDDLEVLGLHVSPDLDSILYALTGVADEERGWGRAEESWNALATVSAAGGETWFQLGDRDIGLHLVRTALLREGIPLSAVTAQLAAAFGLPIRLLPATDDPLRTFIQAPAGTFTFQEWFVARAHRDEVDAVHYAGAPEARAAPGAIELLDAAELIVIAPSNPYVSILPILAVEEIRRALERRSSTVRGGQSADRRSRGEGARRPDARPIGRRHDARGGSGLLPRPDRRARDRRGRCPGGSARRGDGGRDPHAHVGRGRAAPPGERRPRRRRGARVRVAILGGTGSFGGALARRLTVVGEDELVIGSRDGERARASAALLGAEGAVNEVAVLGVDLVVLAVAAGAALDTASGIAHVIGETPLLSVASAISFAGDGVRPDPDGLSLAERVQLLVEGPVVAGLHSVAARNIDEPGPDEDALICGDDAAAKSLAAALAGRLVSGRVLDGGPLANARTLEGLTAVIVNLNRRYKGHAGISVTGLPGV